MEQSLGVSLFQSRKHHLGLTDEGKTAYGYARRIIGLVEEAEASIVDSKIRITGRAVIGYTQALEDYEFPDVLIDFQVAHPEAQLLITRDRVTLLTEMVEDERAGLGFIFTEPSSLRLEVIPILDAACKPVLFGPPGHPIGEMKLAKPAVLEQYPFVHYPLNPRFANYFRSLRVIPNQVMELNDLGAIKRAVERGIGISLDGEDALRHEPPGRFTVVPFAGPPLDGYVRAIRSKRRHPSVLEVAVLNYVLERLSLPT